MMILVTILVSSSVLCLFFYFTDNQRKNDNGNVVLMTFGVFCSQGMNTLPKSMSAKIAIFMVLMTGLVLNASYSANLTSFLFVKKVQVPFTDLKSLYHETDFSVGSVSGSSWQAHVKNHAEESIVDWFNLLESRIKAVNYVPEGIEQMMFDSSSFSFFAARLSPSFRGIFMISN